MLRFDLLACSIHVNNWALEISVIFDTRLSVFGVGFVLRSCHDPGDLCPSFRSVWFVAAFTFEISG